MTGFHLLPYLCYCAHTETHTHRNSHTRVSGVLFLVLQELLQSFPVLCRHLNSTKGFLKG